MADYTAEIGARLRVTREHIGLSQPDVGDALGVGFTAISKYEMGKRVMPQSVLIRFVLAFEITADWILLGDVAGLDAAFRQHLTAYHPSLVRTRTKQRPVSGAAAAAPAVRYLGAQRGSLRS